jgi:CRISPR/Cas system CMR-associated protein Cmr5 small subunit
MDDKIVKEQVKNAFSFCCRDDVFDLDKVSQDNYLSFRSRFFMDIVHNGYRSHDAIMIVLYWLKPFADEDIRIDNKIDIL